MQFTGDDGGAAISKEAAQSRETDESSTDHSE